MTMKADPVAISVWGCVTQKRWSNVYISKKCQPTAVRGKNTVGASRRLGVHWTIRHLVVIRKTFVQEIRRKVEHEIWRSRVLQSYNIMTKKENAIFINVSFLHLAWTKSPFLHPLSTKEKIFLTKPTLHYVSRDCGNRDSLYKHYITADECYYKHEYASNISTRRVAYWSARYLLASSLLLCTAGLAERWVVGLAAHSFRWCRRNYIFEQRQRQWEVRGCFIAAFTLWSQN
jgi:hypothetical protein